MRPRLLRAFLAAVLLVTIAAGLMPAAPSDEIGKARTIIAGALASQGLAVQEISPAPQPNVVPAPVRVSAPGCDRPLQVTALGLSFEDAPLLEVLLEPDFERRYIYFGRSWSAPSPLAAHLEWLKRLTLSMLLPRYSRPPKWVLLAAEPPDCQVIEQIDWGPVWSPPPAVQSANMALKNRALPTRPE